MDIIQLMDSVKIPFEIPVLLHPPVVHFAIAIPVIALLLEIANLGIKRRCVGVVSGLLLILAGVVYMAAFATGKVDGKEAYALLSAEGKEELAEHKKLGAYLVIGIWVVVLLKILFTLAKKFWAKALFVLILAGFVAAAFKQGKDGGELVYEYGANVEAVTKMDDRVMELEEELETLKEHCTLPAAAAGEAKGSESAKEESKEQAASEPAQKSEAVSEEKSEQETGEAPKSEEQKSEIEQKASEALEQLKGDAGDEAAKTEASVEELKEAAEKAAEEVKEAAEAAKDEAEHKASEAVDAAKEAATDALNHTQEQTTLPAAH